MKLIITMSGQSARFTSAGYKEKSFIKVLDKHVIEHVVSMFDGLPYEDIYFIVRADDWYSQTRLPELFPFCKVVPIKANLDGPVMSILSASLDIDEHEEVIVNYCDFTASWDFGKFLSHVRTENIQGCMTTHTGFHPHRLYNDSFAFIRNYDTKILEVKEKECFTDNFFEEHASNGTYYFSSFSIMNKYFNEQVSLNDRTRGEFYVTMPFNLMIRDGLNVHLYETKNFMCFGTPRDIETINAWSYILNQSGVCTANDLNSSAKYWGEMFYDIQQKLRS